MLVASNVSVNMLRDDVLSAWLLPNTTGWRLVYKTEEELRAIFEEAGFVWEGAYYDEPTRFHAMGMGRVPVRNAVVREARLTLPRSGMILRQS